MPHVAYKSNLRSVVRSSVHPCPGNWVAIGHAVVYYALADQAFSAGIRLLHCTYIYAYTHAYTHTTRCYTCMWTRGESGAFHSSSTAVWLAAL